MKKILIVSSSPFISGAEISLKQFLERIDEKYQIFLITGNTEFFKPINVVSIISISPIIDKVSSSRFLVKSVVINKKCFCKVAKFKPDLIYFNTTNSFLNFFWIGILFFRTKKIWHVRDNLKKKNVIKILKFFSNLIVCNSEFISSQFNNTSKNRVVYGGIDINKYKSQIRSTNRQIKQKTVACIAQLTPWKNQIDFIKAAQIIYEKKPNIKFLLIGDILNPKDLTYKKLLIEEVENRNLDGVIEFVGFDKNIVKVLSEIDVLIHPAIEEPFGRVLIEAMSMEIPVVAYKSGGPQEVIVNKETGYLIPPYNFKLLATQTVKLLENDDLRLKFGQEGRKRVAKIFSIESYVDDMEKLFKVIYTEPIVKKVLLNGLQLGEQNSGVQYYTEYLFKALKQIKPSDFHIDILDSNTVKIKGESGLKRVLFEVFLLKSYIKKKHIDLYHSPHYIVPNIFKIPTVVTIHDLITLDFPELCKNQSVFYFKLFFKRTIHNSKAIITVSNTVKKDILRHFDVDQHKIKVIYPGIDSIFKKTIDFNVTKKHNLPEKYILFVGNIEGKKNLTRLLLAYKELINQKKIEHKLVLVGKDGWKNKSVYKTITKQNLKEHILFTGYVPKKDLPAIYSMADLFVFPSIYEGFGIPPLEAMACGTPVIVSNQGASPEVCGEAGLQVDPYDTHDIAKGIEILLNNKELRKIKINLGLERVKQYNWATTAKETLKVYEEAISI